MLTRQEILDPTWRLRRTRRTKALRRMVQENTLAPNDFSYPLFVHEGAQRREPIGAMPGQFRLSVDLLPAEVEHLCRAGVLAVLLFGIAGYKDARASYAVRRDGVVPKAIRTIKRENPEMVVMTASTAQPSHRSSRTRRSPSRSATTTSPSCARRSPRRAMCTASTTGSNSTGSASAPALCVAVRSASRRWAGSGRSTGRPRSTPRA